MVCLQPHQKYKNISSTARVTFIKKSVIWKTAVKETNFRGEFIVKVTADANVFSFNSVYLTTLSVTQATSVPYNIRVTEKTELKWK